MRGNDDPLRYLTLMVGGPGGGPSAAASRSALAELVPGVVTVGAAGDDTVMVGYDPSAADAWTVSMGLERLGLPVLALLPSGLRAPDNRVA